MVCNLGSLVQNLGKICNWPLYREGKERSKKEADHSILVGGTFNKQGKLHTRLVLEGHKMSRSLYLPTRILKVYIEALISSVTYSVQMVSTTHCSLKAVSLKLLPL